MANAAQNVGIKNSWSLLAFARAHGKPQLGSFESVDPDSGEVRHFKSVIFTDPSNPTNKCFVSFSSNLGELSAKEIAERKDNLQVVELNVSPEVEARRAEKGFQKQSYSLCAVGQNSWQDIDLGL